MTNLKMVFISSSVCLMAVNNAFAAGAAPLLLRSTDTAIPLEQPQIREVKGYERIKITEIKSRKTHEYDLEFYDFNGKSFYRIKLEGWNRPQISKGKKIVAVQKVGIKEQRLEIYNAAGELIKNIKNIKQYEKIDLLDDGAFVAYGFQFTQHRAQGGGLAFYDNKGVLLKNITFKRMGNSNGSFFGKNNSFAILRRTSINGAVLQCYTKEGETKWDYNFTDIAPFNVVSAFSVAGDNVYVRLKSSNKNLIWVFNEAGLQQTEEGR